jgi:hypothetical protein
MHRSWNEIIDFYEQIDSASGRTMVALASAIQASRYATGLFPWTSMMDLCIAQTPVTYPYNGPYLRISPISAGTLELRYVDTFDEEKQWHRAVPKGLSVGSSDFLTNYIGSCPQPSQPNNF